MSGGFGSLPSFASGDDQSSLSPALQAWLQDQQLQAQAQPQAVPPGYTGYNAPAAPAAGDPSRVVQDNVRVPSLSSVANGVMNGATNSGQDAWNAGPGFTQRFLAGQIDPRSEEAAAGGLGVAGLAMTGSMPFEVPAGALRMFGGPSAKTADLTALKEAQWLNNAGAEREHIWDATGWFKAPDGNWKFEIPDELSTVGSPKNAPPGYAQLHHDDLAEAYPNLWQNTGQSIKQAPTSSGRYDELADVIHAQGPNDAAQRSVALHEMQHAIQREENFARGDNPANYGPSAWEAAGRPMLSASPDAAAAQSAWARDQYHRSAGEVEARNVQARMNMTPEQRFNTPPWLTQDVPDDQQIVRLLQQIGIR